MVSRSVTLQARDRARGETASVLISDHRAFAGNLQHRLEQQLKAHGFVISQQPSKAERLISVIVLHRGTGSRQEMEASVRGGYGSRVGSMRGQGAVLLADLLVVRRRVPRNKAHLSNASARNTLSSSQVRIGLYSDTAKALEEHGLEEALGREIAGIAAYAKDSREHTPSSLTPTKAEPKSRKAKARSGKKTRNTKRR